MSYSFEYIDIILLAMIAGFIFLRLRGILGKKTGYEEDLSSSFPHEVPETKNNVKLNSDTFDDAAKNDFLKGAKVAYESIITNFSKGDLKSIKTSDLFQLLIFLNLFLLSSKLEVSLESIVIVFIV